MESSKSRKRASKVKGNGGGTTGLGVHGGSTNNTYIARSPRDRKSSRGGNHRGSSGGAASCSNRRLTQSQIKKLNRVSNAYGLRPDAANGLGLPMSMYNKVYTYERWDRDERNERKSFVKWRERV